MSSGVGVQRGRETGVSSRLMLMPEHRKAYKAGLSILPAETFVRKSSFLLTVLVLLAAFSAAQKPAAEKTEPGRRAPAASAKLLPPAVSKVARLVDPERIRAHVRFLADDLLEGRGTGQRGGDIAALYIATQFALYGLMPAGDDGTFMQKVALVGITGDPQTTVSLVPTAGQPTNLKLYDDIVAVDETQNQADDVDADLVFVGYGIEAPEYKWDDYKGEDVRGKVLLMLVNQPPSDDPSFFKGKALTYYGRWAYKYEEAARKGAAGVILVHETQMASYGWDVVKSSWSGELAYLEAGGAPKLKLASWIQLEIARKIAADSGQDLDQLMVRARSRDFQPVPLPFRVKAHMVNKVRPLVASNVVAMLPGSDPRLKDQAVLYTAHWDHFGIHPDRPSGNIYHGAIDNATGCGVLLETARAYARSSQKPKRSIIFASTAAEEQGLRGSEYLGKHPPVPAARITLALNFDMVAPYGIPEELEVAGAERTTFYLTVETMAKAFRMKIVPDSNPGAGYYYRSDHFPLAKLGIPAFWLKEGLKFEGHPRDWGEQLEKKYIQNQYHQPSDKYHADWDFSGDAKMARLGIALGWEAANQSKLIQWRPGDEFESARKASEGTGMRP